MRRIQVQRALRAGLPLTCDFSEHATCCTGQCGIAAVMFPALPVCSTLYNITGPIFDVWVQRLQAAKAVANEGERALVTGRSEEGATPSPQQHTHALAHPLSGSNTIDTSKHQQAMEEIERLHRALVRACA